MIGEEGTAGATRLASVLVTNIEVEIAQGGVEVASMARQKPAMRSRLAACLHIISPDNTP
jgi:hypothetical protein